MEIARKRILVTGGTGFIGSHLVNRLTELGARVIVPYESLEPKSYFKTKKLDRRVLLAVCDLKNYRRVFDLITKYEIDIIFHLAAQPLVTVAFSNPLETYETNIMGTVNVLEAARQYQKISGVLVTSSDKAYGKIPKATEENYVGGDHPYETSKAAADLISHNYFSIYKLPVVVTRFGNVYGEGDLNFNRIVPGIMKSIIQNEILEIRSNGKFIRDYVYVEDVVDAMIILMKNIKKVKGEAFNVSSLENITVLNLIQRIREILKLKVDYKILSTATHEIPVQSVNFAKIRKTFGWKPRHNLKSSVPEILEWYREYFQV